MIQGVGGCPSEVVKLLSGSWGSILFEKRSLKLEEFCQTPFKGFQIQTAP